MANPDFMNIQYQTITDFVTELTAINNAGQELIEGLTRALHSNTELWNGVAKAATRTSTASGTASSPG